MARIETGGAESGGDEVAAPKSPVPCIKGALNLNFLNMTINKKLLWKRFGLIS